MKVIIATFLTVFSLTVFIISFSKSVQLNQDCTGYLKLSSDANSVETAKEQLDIAISYLESNNLTTGYTSVLWRTPNEDISFWYNNLKDSQSSLAKMDSSASSVDRTNLLIKLRETLMDSGEDGDRVTVPAGLSRFPDNFLWGILRWLAGLTIFGLFAWASSYGK